VGTGFDRSALENLRAQNHGLIFDPDCLTEDYETGLRMFSGGYRQMLCRFVSKRAGRRQRARTSPPAAGSHPAAQPVGRNRAARVGAAWLVRAAAPTVLVLARSQRPGRQFALPVCQSGVRALGLLSF
jgi:hypothetical protein